MGPGPNRSSGSAWPELKGPVGPAEALEPCLRGLPEAPRMDGLTGLLPPTMLPNESVLQQTLPLQAAASQADTWQMQHDHQARCHQYPHGCGVQSVCVLMVQVCRRQYARHCGFLKSGCSCCSHRHDANSSGWYLAWGLRAMAVLGAGPGTSEEMLAKGSRLGGSAGLLKAAGELPGCAMPAKGSAGACAAGADRAAKGSCELAG